MTTATKTHVCLVSQQAAANLLPALDPQLKPARVVLVVTRKMERQASHLAAVLKESAINVETLQLSDEHDFRRSEGELLDLAAKLGGVDVALNITGGTKLMSVAAQSVAQASYWRMFYVDVDTDQVIWLGNEEVASHPLQQQLRLPHYLRSYGYVLRERISRSQASVAMKRLTDDLVLNVANLEDAIGMLNGIAQHAENSRTLRTVLDSRQRDSRALEALLSKFAGAGVLTTPNENGEFTFASEDARSFVKGGWLELHAMQAVHQVHGDLKIRDKAEQLEVTDDSNGTRNELDVAFMARNRLFVIECKTARIDLVQGRGEQATAPKANDALFKLSENCRRIGGLGTRGMLLSYRALRDPEKQLARALGIEVVAGGEIARLADRLRQWVGPGA